MYPNIKIALTIDYGQRGAARELAQARKLAQHFGVEHIAFDLKNFSTLVAGQGALLGKADLPHPQSHELDDLGVTQKSAAAVWVPNRNGVLLALAAALAESRELSAVAVGFNAEEAVTFADNSVDYMQAMTRSLAYSTRNQVEVVSATAALNKVQIVERLGKIGFPFELLWSCYRDGQKHCGQCESCQRLRRAVKTGLPDPAPVLEALGLH